MTIPNKDTTPHSRRMDALQSLLAATKLTISSSSPPPPPTSKGKEPQQNPRQLALQQKKRIMAELAVHKAKLDALKKEELSVLQAELETSTEYTTAAAAGPKQESLKEDIQAHVEHYQFGLETVGAALEYIADMYVKGVEEAAEEEGSGYGKDGKDHGRDSGKGKKDTSSGSGKGAKGDSCGHGKGANDEPRDSGESIHIPTGPRRR